jgi:hypothetical protein
MSEILLIGLDEAFDAKSWHGTNLRGSLRGLDVATLAWRPGADRHNIWELAVHAAYWKYAVRRKLTGEKRGSFPLGKGSNFWKRPIEETMAAWRRDLLLLVGEHQALRIAVSSFPAGKWSRRPKGGRFTYEEMVRGVAAHDLYHAGQIQLLKRLQQELN